MPVYILPKIQYSIGSTDNFIVRIAQYFIQLYSLLPVFSSLYLRFPSCQFCLIVLRWPRLQSTTSKILFMPLSTPHIPIPSKAEGSRVDGKKWITGILNITSQTHTDWKCYAQNPPRQFVSLMRSCFPISYIRSLVCMLLQTKQSLVSL